MSKSEEQKFKVDLGDGRPLEIARSNATHYTFFGNLSFYNHVFLDNPPEASRSSNAEGTTDTPSTFTYIDSLQDHYVFAHDPRYNMLVAFLREHDFPQFLNLPDVTDTDRDALIDLRSRQMEDIYGSSENLAD